MIIGNLRYKKLKTRKEKKRKKICVRLNREVVELGASWVLRWPAGQEVFAFIACSTCVVAMETTVRSVAGEAVPGELAQL